jgi:hypothetical protein
VPHEAAMATAQLHGLSGVDVTVVAGSGGLTLPSEEGELFQVVQRWVTTHY